jgi:hypothetical protein
MRDKFFSLKDVFALVGAALLQTILFICGVYIFERFGFYTIAVTMFNSTLIYPYELGGFFFALILLSDIAAELLRRALLLTYPRFIRYFVFVIPLIQFAFFLFILSGVHLMGVFQIALYNSALQSTATIFEALLFFILLIFLSELFIEMIRYARKGGLYYA